MDILSSYDKKKTIYTIYETKNGSVIRKVIRDADVKDFMFPHKVEELTGLKNTAILDKNMTVYAMRINGEIAGVAFFSKKNESATVDEAFLPKFRGKHALALGKRVLLDYINNHDVTELVGRIRRTNKRALLFSQWLQFSIVEKDETFFYVRRKTNG